MNNEKFERLAGESLNAFEEIAVVAKQRVDDRDYSNSVDAFANTNTFTADAANRKLRDIQKGELEAYLRLCSEPAIARVVTEDQTGREHIFFISRRSSLKLPSGIQLASYQSPVGRLASLVPGDEYQVTDDKHYIREISTFHPKRFDEWDSIDTEFRDHDDNVFTIDSLRALLVKGDDFEAWLTSSDYDNVVNRGVKHQILTAMGLRDKPLLDRFQDEIHRLPLNNQLILLGPPGTGKTTTLIKRLSQKLNRDALDSNELSLVAKAQSYLEHEQSWIMFTPSDLLKHYLKEAFSRESVPASDDKVRTWTKHRDELARSSFKILRSVTGGLFTLSNDSEYLSSRTRQNPEQWFEAYREHHEKRLRQQLQAGVVQLSQVSEEFGSELFEKLKSKVGNIESKSMLAIYRDLDSLDGELSSRLSEIKEDTDSLLKKEMNLIFNKNRLVFDDLREFLQTIDADEASDDEVFDSDEDESTDSTGTLTRQDVVNKYKSTIKSLARATAQGKKLSANSQAQKIIDFLGEQVPSEESRRNIGRLMLVQNSIRRFTGSKRLFVTNVAQSYRDFRRVSLKSSQYFAEDTLEHQRISSMELDAIVLLLLKNARALLSEAFVSRDIDSGRFSYLREIKEVFRNQIMVDEATDFSSIQLACMYNLASLETRSFFACGDFNQRITSVGIRTKDQLEWAAKDITTRTINVVYRQSRKLNDLAKALLKTQGGDLATAGDIPKDSIHEGVEPALIEGNSSNERIEWVANRIVEIEKQVRQMPTIAVLVKNEELVENTAEQLTEYLEQYNLKAAACQKGQSLGEGTDVRVFDIQHIKGLEFEAVFFMDVDDLAEYKPELFDRYLYVGATRAATYLGITCSNKLPSTLESLRNLFIDNWQGS